ncbi:unnamed protein product, partial [Iphiclides podalirius]
MRPVQDYPRRGEMLYAEAPHYDGLTNTNDRPENNKPSKCWPPLDFSLSFPALDSLRPKLLEAGISGRPRLACVAVPLPLSQEPVPFGEFGTIGGERPPNKYLEPATRRPSRPKAADGFGHLNKFAIRVRSRRVTLRPDGKDLVNHWELKTDTIYCATHCRLIETEIRSRDGLRLAIVEPGLDWLVMSPRLAVIWLVMSSRLVIGLDRDICVATDRH